MISAPLLFEPYVTVGPIRFGMHRFRVLKLWGMPQKTVTNFLQETRDSFEDVFVTYGKDTQGVVEFSFGPRSPSVQFRGKLIAGASTDADLRDVLRGLDGASFYDDGFWILPTFGITVGDQEEDGKPAAVGFYAKGRLDL